jgi:hypothetical protein
VRGVCVRECEGVCVGVLCIELSLRVDSRDNE